MINFNTEQLQFSQFEINIITVVPMTTFRASQTGFNAGASVLHEPIRSAGNHFMELIPGLSE